VRLAEDAFGLSDLPGLVRLQSSGGDGALVEEELPAVVAEDP
jgi:hypothetical protein